MKLSEGQVIAAVRQCARCGNWKGIGNFQRRSRTCYVCSQPVDRSYGIKMARSIQITPKGMAAVAAMRAEDAA
jgi:hypothetical protein